MKKLFLDDIRIPKMVYDTIETKDFIVVRNYADFVKYIKQNGLPDFISFDNDLGLNENGEVAPDGYAAAKWLVYESNLDLRRLRFKVHSANPVAAEQIRELLSNYIRFLKEK
ncbi:hypothetical protein J0871_16535 [Salegentibacter sp. BDJ18]|uniref:cyclic-phosphate processing receiver domain-containing protein n=1 Tax=Salegentibacter sp. BDJ18 TaxID=2816376 RepID=UPI001AAEF6C4|nr:hypothetical protein [Salegentibacter sp. BDJ18]